MIGFKLDNSNQSDILFEKNKEIYLSHPFEFGLESYGKRDNFIFGREINFHTNFLQETIVKNKHSNSICHLTLKNKILNISEKEKSIWLFELMEELNFAYGLGAKYTILHGTSKERKIFEENIVINNIQNNAKKLIEKSHVPFCIENTYENLDFYIKLFENMHSKVGFCIDLGHFKVHDKSYLSDLFKEKLFLFLDKLASEQRIIHFHLHDNDGYRDRHWGLNESINKGYGFSQVELIKRLHNRYFQYNFILETRNDTMENNLEDFDILLQD